MQNIFRAPESYAFTLWRSCWKVLHLKSSQDTVWNFKFKFQSQSFENCTKLNSIFWISYQKSYLDIKVNHLCHATIIIKPCSKIPCPTICFHDIWQRTQVLIWCDNTSNSLTILYSSAFSTYLIELPHFGFLYLYY